MIVIVLQDFVTQESEASITQALVDLFGRTSQVGITVTKHHDHKVGVVVDAPTSLRETVESIPSVAKARWSKEDLKNFIQRVGDLIQAKGSVSSFEAQAELGLEDDPAGPARLRRAFGELIDEGCIHSVGQKRGTRYIWGAPLDAVGSPGEVKVSKKK